MGTLHRPLHNAEVRVVDASHTTSYEQLVELLHSTGCQELPMLLRNASFAGGAMACHASDFGLEALEREIGQVRLPQQLKRREPGTKRPSSRRQCGLFVAQQQHDEDVLGATPINWDPCGCTFRDFAELVRGGSGLYLTTRSGKGTCSFDGDKVTYEDPCGDGADEDDRDVLIRAIAPRTPAPVLLPQRANFQLVIWLGARGNNFGLHTDLFAEQFLVQHEGVKEVLLLLPEDARTVAPFPYLQSPLWYKSERRSVRHLDLPSSTECLRAELHPGDILYIPLWWWHEVRTLSAGPSVSVTYRFHTAEAEDFNHTMDVLWRLNMRAQAASPSGRLARHLRSFLVHGQLAADGKAADQLVAVGQQQRLAAAIALAAVVGGLGFAAGRWSRQSGCL